MVARLQLMQLVNHTHNKPYAKMSLHRWFKANWLPMPNTQAAEKLNSL
jgi:hypothetical protein